MYCNPCYKWTPSDDNSEIDLPVCCNPWSDWITSYNRENDSPVYCNPWCVWTTSYTERMIHLCIATPDLTEKHPGTTPEKSAYLCVAFPWYDWRTSQYNTWEVSVPVCCLPLFPRGHCRSVSASRWPSRWSLHLGWQTNWWRQESLKETDQKKAFSSRGAFTWRRRIVERLAYYSFPVFRLIGEYIFIDLFHSIQRSIRPLSSTFPNTPAPRTETGSVTNFINHRLAVSPLLGKRALSPKCPHVLCTLCKCPHVLLR